MVQSAIDNAFFMITSSRAMEPRRVHLRLIVEHVNIVFPYMKLSEHGFLHGLDTPEKQRKLTASAPQEKMDTFVMRFRGQAMYLDGHDSKPSDTVVRAIQSFLLECKAACLSKKQRESLQVLEELTRASCTSSHPGCMWNAWSRWADNVSKMKRNRVMHLLMQDPGLGVYDPPSRMLRRVISLRACYAYLSGANDIWKSVLSMLDLYMKSCKELGHASIAAALEELKVCHCPGWLNPNSLSSEHDNTMST